MADIPFLERLRTNIETHTILNQESQSLGQDLKPCSPEHTANDAVMALTFCYNAFKYGILHIRHFQLFWL